MPKSKFSARQIRIEGVLSQRHGIIRLIQHQTAKNQTAFLVTFSSLCII